MALWDMKVGDRSMLLLSVRQIRVLFLLLEVRIGGINMLLPSLMLIHVRLVRQVHIRRVSMLLLGPPLIRIMVLR